MSLYNLIFSVWTLFTVGDSNIVYRPFKTWVCAGDHIESYVYTSVCLALNTLLVTKSVVLVVLNPMWLFLLLNIKFHTNNWGLCFQVCARLAEKSPVFGPKIVPIPNQIKYRSVSTCTEANMSKAGSVLRCLNISSDLQNFHLSFCIFARYTYTPLQHWDWNHLYLLNHINVLDTAIM